MKKLSILTLALVGMAVSLPSGGAEAFGLSSLKNFASKGMAAVKKVGGVAAAALKTEVGKAISTELEASSLAKLKQEYDSNSMAQKFCTSYVNGVEVPVIGVKITSEDIQTFVPAQYQKDIAFVECACNYFIKGESACNPTPYLKDIAQQVGMSSSDF